MSEELGREVDPGELERQVIAELAKSYELVDWEIDEPTVAEARRGLESAGASCGATAAG